MSRDLPIRLATEADLERVIEIESAAYPDERSHDTLRRQLTQHPMGGLDALRVVEEDGAVVGQGFLFAASMWLGGALVRVGAIASLAVAPEARERGLATALLASMHEELQQRGACLSILYPFSGAFYEKHGYAPTSPLVWLRLAPSSLASLAERTLRASENGPHSLTFAAGEHRAAEIRQLYERNASKHSGFLARHAQRWERSFADARRHWLIAQGSERTAVGYLAYSYETRTIHGASSLLVHELLADGPATRLALLGALSAQGRQIDVVELRVSIDDPLLFALADGRGPRQGEPRIEHPLGICGSGPMVSLVDVLTALEERGYSRDGDSTITIEDDTGPLAGRPIDLQVRSGRARATRRESGAAGHRHHLSVRRSTLASMIAAGMTPGDAVRMGRAHAATPDTVALADGLFAGPRFHCLDPF